MANETPAEARRRRELKAIADFKKLKPAPDKKRKKRATASDAATKKASAKKKTPNTASNVGKGLAAIAGGRKRQIDAAVRKAKGG